VDRRHPYVAIGRFVHPAAVVLELVPVLGDGGRQVGGRRLSVAKRIARFIPAVEAVHRGAEGFGVGPEFPVRGDEPLVRPDDRGAALSGGLGRALMDQDLGGTAFADLEAVEPRFEDIEGGVGGVDLDALIRFEGRHPEEGLPGPDVDLEGIVAPQGKGGELGFAQNAEPEEVAPSELDFGLAVPGHELVPLRNKEVHLGRLRPELRSPVEGGLALDVAQPGIALVGGLVRLGKGREGSQRHEGRENRSEYPGFSHLLSPHAPYKSKNRASSLPIFLPGDRRLAYNPVLD